MTAPRSRLHLPVEETVTELNPILRGWGAYFRRAGNARQMSQIHHYVRLRVALFASKKRRRRGVSPWQLCRDARCWQDLDLYALSAGTSA